MPSIWRGSGEPITRSRNSARSASPAGRSLSRKNPPLEVPPRIHITGALFIAPLRAENRFPRFLRGAASNPFEAHVLQLVAETVHVEPEHAARQLLALV